MNPTWLPTLCTVLNLGAGTASLLLTVNGHYRLALIWIAMAAVFDVLDGLLARLLHCTSEFGKQLDSLADLISFGAAPAMLVLLYQLDDDRWLGPAAVILFVICGALRLARFNISGSINGFTGLPITAAGTLLALSSLSGPDLPSYWTIILMAVMSLLMISRIPFPAFKNKMVRK
ncbi:CDP-diacylglycerol--serine O-phosphatidyltransferase [Paenibacillus bovis]|uniref:CDP-diacylglycerol--serine O-phosphatidyltransferase n=1 Tax=Paenibacillus bovis TaxID=1616788 RepID=A0A172ZHH6_9BACL|nr:CDP-diacylglycerol--serine O-phosphatidyltransferase [Paenibacillus bovis]ANF97091.1 CDP-diacylglycerol--serine O-phosphatidyltransferase [Paenibacillus bovis]